MTDSGMQPVLNPSAALLAERQIADGSVVLATLEGTRSEERRVGKECRSRCDWSSDVCSSDLNDRQRHAASAKPVGRIAGRASNCRWLSRPGYTGGHQIGRASCRERV